MKSVYKFIAVLALLSALGATSFAQSARRTVVQIPFDFVVGGKTLPAGRYRVAPIGSNAYATWEVRSTSRDAGAIAMTTAIGGGSAQNESRLVFRKEGGTYFLAEVWTTADRAGHALKQSRRRADAQSADAGKLDSETVVIAMSTQE